MMRKVHVFGMGHQGGFLEEAAAGSSDSGDAVPPDTHLTPFPEAGRVSPIASETKPGSFA